MLLTQSMKILWLTPYPPAAPLHGGRIRLQGLLAGALRSGHTVDLRVVATGGSQEGELLSDDLRTARLMSHCYQPARTILSPRLSWLISRWPEAVSEAWSPALDRELRLENPKSHDIAVLGQAHMARYLPTLLSRHIPVLLDAHNVETDLRRDLEAYADRLRTRVRLRTETKRFARLERQLLSGVTAIAATSRDDADRLQELAPRVPIRIVPSPVDLDYFRFVDHASCSSPRVAVMTGTLGYIPNVDAIRWFHAKILPHLRTLVPDLRIDVVGGSPPPSVDALGGQQVRVVGNVPDVRDYLSRADVFSIPIRIGSGTRLKAVEALASGLPVVSTTKGVEGLGLRDSQEVLLGDTPEAFAHAMHRALVDSRLRRQLIDNGYRHVAKLFSLTTVQERFAKVLDETVSLSEGS
jgi:glycosyltransferase involved in cell wall biosynthesis